MPDYGKRTGRDVTDDILIRLRDLERTVKKLDGTAKRSTLDRGDTATVDAPFEGQTMIQYDTDVAKYYADGAWRNFAGTGVADLPYITLNAGAYDVTTGTETDVQYGYCDAAEGNLGTAFSTTGSSPVDFTINESGLYFAHLVLNWQLWPGSARSYVKLVAGGDYIGIPRAGEFDADRADLTSDDELQWLGMIMVLSGDEPFAPEFVTYQASGSTKRYDGQLTIVKLSSIPSRFFPIE